MLLNLTFFYIGILMHYTTDRVSSVNRGKIKEYRILYFITLGS